MGEISTDVNTIILFIGVYKSESGRSDFPGKEKYKWNF